MHRQCTLAALTGLAGLVITAPGLGQSQPSGPAEPPATAPAAARREPTITVLSPGASPRKLLRLAPKPETAQPFDLTMSRQSVEAEAVSTQAPPMTWTFDTSVTKLDDRGDIHYSYECSKIQVGDDPTIPPDILAAMRAGIQGVVGTGGTGIISARAVSRSAEASIPPDLNPALTPYVRAMEGMFHQFATPLPEEPIGIGAQWRATDVLLLDAIEVDQAVVFTLLDSDGTMITLDLQVSQSAADQQVQAANQTVTIKSLLTEGTGSVQRRLDRAFPTQASFKYVSETVVAADAGGWEQEFRQKVEQTTEVRGK